MEREYTASESAMIRLRVEAIKTMKHLGVWDPADEKCATDSLIIQALSCARILHDQANGTDPKES